MKFFAADAEVSHLEAVLTQPWDEGVLSATIALAWHLRQRDSARAAPGRWRHSVAGPIARPDRLAIARVWRQPSATKR
jgi:hypothetical protein